MVERRSSEQKKQYIHNIMMRIKQKREKVCHTMERAIPKLKKEISEKNEILVAPEDLGKKLGLGFTLSPRHPIAIYWDAKYCLWKDGIYVGTIKKDSKKLRIIRFIKPEDELPKGLILEK